MNKPKDKGRRGEHKTSEFFNRMFGKPVCKRVSGSGMFANLPGDNLLNIMEFGYRRPFQIQTKNCKNPAGWATMDKLTSRGGDEIAVVWKTNDPDPMIVMRGSMLVELMEPVIQKEATNAE